MARYIVCCPIRGHEGIHMSFSKVYDNLDDAREHRDRIAKMPDLMAPYKGPWGDESNLYELAAYPNNPLYNNDRLPHVRNGPKEDITVLLSEAYIKEIGKKRA